MREFFKAFVYFVENGLPEKLAKDLAEKVTGVKAPTGKIEIPKTKGPDEFQMPKAADDVIELVITYLVITQRVTLNTTQMF